jgi:uncharacterized protein
MTSAFLDMTAQECRARLAGSTVGRVAFCGRRGPQIYPVNYAVDDGDVVFRVAPYTNLGMEVVGSPVAFEVDDLDPESRSGWSVVVSGTAVAVDDPDDLTRLRRRGPEPWAQGQRQLVVRIASASVTGRQVSGG